MSLRRWPSLTPPLAATVALCLLTLWLVKPLYPAFLAAPVFTALISPLYDKLSSRLGRALALAICLVTLILLVAIPLLWLAVSLFNQATDFVNTTSSTGLAHLHFLTFDIGAHIAANASALASWLAIHALSWAVSLVGGVGQFALAILLTAFLLPNRATVWRHLQAHLPIDKALSDALRSTFTDLSRTTLLGYSISCTSQGLILGVAFHILGFSHVLFWATVAGLTGLVPVLGSTIVWLPSVIFLVSVGRHEAATALALVSILAVGNIDTIIRPMLYQRMARVHPLVTLLGVIAGVPFFGPLGIILGPLVIASTIKALAHITTTSPDPLAEVPSVPGSATHCATVPDKTRALQ